MSIKANWNNDVRRVKVDLDAADAFKLLVAALVDAYQMSPASKISVRYLDDEDEMITVSTTAELREAVRISEQDGRKSLKVFVVRDGDQLPELKRDVSFSSNSVDSVHSDADFVQVDASPDLELLPSAESSAEPKLLEPVAVSPAPAPAPAPVPSGSGVPCDEVVTIQFGYDDAPAKEAPAVEATAPHAVPEDSPAHEENGAAEAAGAPALVPAPVPTLDVKEEPLVVGLTHDEIVALVVDFLQQEWAAEEVEKASEIALNGVKQHQPIDAVVGEILLQRPRIAESSLALQLTPYLPAVFALAKQLDLSHHKIAKIVESLPQLLKAWQQPHLLAILDKVLHGDFSNFEGVEHGEVVLDIPARQLSEEEQALAIAEADAAAALLAQAEADEADEEAKQPSQGPWEHPNVRCDVCQVKPVIGNRFKCTVCDDYDMCENCEAAGTHPKSHVLLKIRRPIGYLQSRRLMAMSQEMQAHGRRRHGHSHGHPVHRRPCRKWSEVNAEDSQAKAVDEHAVAAAKAAAEAQAKAEAEAKAAAEAQAQAEAIAKAAAEAEAQKQKELEEKKKTEEEAERQAIKAKLVNSFKYAHQLVELENMGFTAIDLNMQLLLNHKGDVARVVDALINNYNA